MTLKRLESYADLRREVQLLEMRIAEVERQAQAILSDVVTASMREFPYTQQRAIVKGHSPKRRDQLKLIMHTYQRRDALLYSELLEIEKWLEGVQDSKVRQIVELKYIMGKSWNAAARRIYGKPCGDNARMYLSRYLKRA